MPIQVGRNPACEHGIQLNADVGMSVTISQYFATSKRSRNYKSLGPYLPDTEIYFCTAGERDPKTDLTISILYLQCLQTPLP